MLLDWVPGAAVRAGAARKTSEVQPQHHPTYRGVEICGSWVAEVLSTLPLLLRFWKVPLFSQSTNDRRKRGATWEAT